jgi:hypothetical protein
MHKENSNIETVTNRTPKVLLTDSLYMATMDGLCMGMGLESFSSGLDRISRKYAKKPKVPYEKIESKAEEKRKRKQLKRLENCK